MARLLAVFLSLALLVIVPYLIWGGHLEDAFSVSAALEWLRGFGGWAWAVGIGLLVADLVLPIPATAIMTVLGMIYGALVGGIVASIGAVAAGLAGYLLCRAFGERVARRLLGERGLTEGRRVAGGIGMWLVVLSRWLPVFPEVVACMAGLTRMPAKKFVPALACGAVPLGFAFAALGSTGQLTPGFALAASAVVPPVLFLLVRPVLGSRQQHDTTRPPEAR